MVGFMAADRETMKRILNSVPQQHPFRFIDDILELDDEHIVGTYRFREDEYFYKGHFPGQPITPGVILIEAMAQTGVVAFGLYLHMRQMQRALDVAKKLTTLFTLAEGVEFTGVVHPGERVIIKGQNEGYHGKGKWRDRELWCPRREGSTFPERVIFSGGIH
jgi:3-hydroxyacyl-[acyl-carrier-protein] dehydratase